MQEKCDHGDDKQHTYLDFMPLGEVYMCECGVLIDLCNESNFPAPFTPMSPAALEAQFKAHARAVVEIIKRNIDEATK